MKEDNENGSHGDEVKPIRAIAFSFDKFMALTAAAVSPNMSDVEYAYRKDALKAAGVEDKCNVLYEYTGADPVMDEQINARPVSLEIISASTHHDLLQPGEVRISDKSSRHSSVVIGDSISSPPLAVAESDSQRVYVLGSGARSNRRLIEELKKSNQEALVILDTGDNSGVFPHGQFESMSKKALDSLNKRLMVNEKQNQKFEHLDRKTDPWYRKFAKK